MDLSPVGDMTLCMLYAIEGGACYIDREMSCYRINSIGSWTVRMREDTEKHIIHYEKMNQVYTEYDRLTSGKYTDIMQYWVQRQEYYILLLQKNYKDAYTKKYRRFYSELSLVGRIALALNAKAPHLMAVYHAIRDRRKKT